jgi:hypothetical protein
MASHGLVHDSVTLYTQHNRRKKSISFIGSSWNCWSTRPRGNRGLDGLAGKNGARDENGDDGDDVRFYNNFF